MSESIEEAVERFMADCEGRNPGEAVFLQAVREVVESVMPLVLDDASMRRDGLLERLTEPDRIVSFRVAWEDDDGDVHVNRAWRVQFNHALGPYKGGLRFSPAVDQSVLKFLGFEQTFKNALTGLPMGGAKGGANFDPKGRSEREIMRFCHAMMAELSRHIGPNVDVPAGDIGVGAREIGFLFGQYLRLSNEWTGTLTGKGCQFGGSAGREEATGHGCVYFLDAALERAGEGLDGKRVLVSGAGNVALHAAEKALEKGACVLTLSDSGGLLLARDGLTPEQLAAAKRVKLEEHGRLEALAEDDDSLAFHADCRPWGVAGDIALPCATENEIDDDDARTLIDNGILAVCEGANMPCTAAASRRLRASCLLYAPGKAANAGGVAVSGLEQSQNAQRLSWSREQVDERLKTIMESLHDACVARGGDGAQVDYVQGANRAAFEKVAAATRAFGIL